MDYISTGSDIVSNNGTSRDIFPCSLTAWHFNDNAFYRVVEEVGGKIIYRILKYLE